MSFHLENWGRAVSDNETSVTVIDRELLRYEGGGLDLCVAYGAANGVAVLSEKALDQLPQPLRLPVRQDLSEAMSLIYEGRCRWA